MSLSPRLQAQQEMMLAKDALSVREQLYVRARLQGSPPAAAARIAGIKDHQALDASNKIRRAMQTASRVVRHQRKLQREDVLAGFMDAVHMASCSADLIGAWREIAKVSGLYEPTKVEVSVNPREQLEQMSDAELINIAATDYQVLDFEEPPTDGDPDAEPQ